MCVFHFMFSHPLQAAAFVSDDATSSSSWRNLFLSASAGYVCATVAYAFMARFNPEKFNFDEKEEEREEGETTKL